MALTSPEWVTRHGCSLVPGVEKGSYVVMVGTGPQYLLKPAPLAGKHGCSVTQTINGKRLDTGGTYSTPDEAIGGGLEDLRKALGW